MQVTKELLQIDIKNLTAQLDQLKAQSAQTAGAISAIESIIAYMDKPEPVADDASVVEEAHSQEITGASAPEPVVDGRGHYVENEIAQ